MYKREQRDGARLAYSLTATLGAEPPPAPDTGTTVITVPVSPSPASVQGHHVRPRERPTFHVHKRVLRRGGERLGLNTVALCQAQCRESWWIDGTIFKC